MHKPLPFIVTALTLSSVCLGQISFHTAAGGGEMWRVDHQTNTATMLTVPAALSSGGSNCILMTSMTTGYVGTVTAPTNIYAINIAGNTVTLGNSGNALNTSATAGGNLSQIVELLGNLYFATQGGAGGGVLGRIPVAGGPVQTRLDISTLSSPAAPGLCNAVAKVGLKIYVGTFYSGGTATRFNEIIEHDPLGAAGNGKVIMQIPPGKYKPSTTSTVGIGIVNMHEHKVGTNTYLAVLGVYGDLLIIDVNASPAPTVISHYFTGRQTSPTTMASNVLNSFHFDPTANDWVIGSRSLGAVERIAEGHNADNMIARPAGSGATSVNGTYYFPNSKNDDKSSGAAGKEAKDCAGASGYKLTDVARGPAVSPNANFAFAVYSGNGGDPYLLGLGVKLATPVQILGCALQINPLIIVGGVLSGAAAGAGTATIPVAIPANTKLTALARQWVAGSASFAMSNARVTNIN